MSDEPSTGTTAPSSSVPGTRMTSYEVVFHAGPIHLAILAAVFAIIAAIVWRALAARRDAD